MKTLKSFDVQSVLIDFHIEQVFDFVSNPAKSTRGGSIENAN